MAPLAIEDASVDFLARMIANLVRNRPVAIREHSPVGAIVSTSIAPTTSCWRGYIGNYLSFAPARTSPDSGNEPTAGSNDLTGPLPDNSLGLSLARTATQPRSCADPQVLSVLLGAIQGQRMMAKFGFLRTRNDRANWKHLSSKMRSCETP